MLNISYSREVISQVDADLGVAVQRRSRETQELLLPAVVISEGHSLKNEVTRHPVEEGAKITDHIRSEPRTLTIAGCISDTPITQDQSPKYTPDGPSIGQTQWEKLTLLSDQHYLLDIVTTRGVYRNMVITSIEAPVDQSTGEAINFTCSFTQIRTVETKSERLFPVAVHNGNGKVNKGPQEPTAVAPKDSLLYQWFGGGK